MVALAVAALAFSAAWVALLYSVSWHAFAANSDDANVVLAGHSFVHGNPFLHGWQLPADPYWLTDVAVYGAFVAVTGLRASLMHAVPAALAASVVLVAVWLASRGAPRGGWTWTGGATTFVIIGLPVPLFSTFFLQGPQHVATILACLIAFAALAGAPSRRRWVLATVLLAAAVVGDPFGLAIGIAPVVAGALVAASRARQWREAVPGVAAAATSSVAAFGARAATSALGGFTISRGPPMAPPRRWPHNVAELPHRALALLGVLHEVAIPGQSTPSRLVHLAGALACAAAIIVSSALIVGRLLRRGPPSPQRGLEDVVTLGAWACLGASVVLTPRGSDFNADRYLIAAVVFGSILAVRMVTRARLPQGFRSVPSIALSCVGLTVGAFYLTASLSALRVPEPTNSAAPLAQWLRARGLSRGFGAYWDASIVTLEDRGRIRIRPVIASRGRLHALHFFASSYWFVGRERTAPARFLVFEPARPFDHVNDATALATFGPPASSASVGPYRILLWDHDLSPALGAPTGIFQ